jgi:hypothetical protein
VEIPAVLAADLNALATALDGSGSELEQLLGALVDDLRVAVDSYLGLMLTMVLDERPLTLVTMVWPDELAQPGAVGSSVSMSLAGLPDAGSGSELVLYAAEPGAFVDLAADVAFALGQPLSTIVFDAHLRPPAPSGGISGLAELMRLNRAVGILINRGFTAEGAQLELHRRARIGRVDLDIVVEKLLRTTSLATGKAGWQG